jgi:hypothetical protein
MKIPSVNLKTGYIPFAGGLDTNTPPMACPAGTIADSINVLEDVYGGYKRIEGYIRFDGKSDLVDIPYKILPVSLNLPISVGAIINQSGVTGKVLSIDSGVTTTRLLVTRLTGEFQIGDIEVDSITVGSVTSILYPDIIPSKSLNIYKTLIEDEYRSEILPVPGVDSTLGGIYYNDSLYVFRNSSNTEAKLYKSSTAGWNEILLGDEIIFTSGNSHISSISTGSVITGVTSGATANVEQIIVSSGSTLAGDAEGKIIISGKTGTFTSEFLRIGSNNCCQISGSSEVKFSPDGKFQMVLDNFGTGQKVYGVDGKNRPFEFSGTDYSLIFIETGMDTFPNNICGHVNRLFLSYGNSLQASSFLSPHNFSGLEGAIEINIGDDIQGLCSLMGSDTSSCLGVFGGKKLSILYGSNSENFKLVDYDSNLQTVPYSVQQLQNVWYLGSQGISTLQATQAFGNFQNTSYSQKISRWLNNRIGDLTCSAVSQSTNDYILFFNSGYGLYCKIGNNKNGVFVKSFMPINFPNKVLWATTGMVNAEEKMWFGSDNGYVYQMNVGKNFDGAPINWYMDLHFYSFNAPMTDKRFRSAELEAIGIGYSDFTFTYSLGYGTEDINQPLIVSFSVDSWDNFIWDNFIWDGKTIMSLKYKLNGISDNLSIKLTGANNYSDSLRISGASILYQNLKYAR